MTGARLFLAAFFSSVALPGKGRCGSVMLTLMKNDFFASYMKSPKTFDRTNAEAVCGEGAFAYPLDRALLEQFGHWFLEHVERTPRRARRTAQPA